MQTALNIWDEIDKINKAFGIDTRELVRRESRKRANKRFDEIMSSDDEFRRAVFDAALRIEMQHMFKSMVNNAMSRDWHPKDGLPHNPGMGQYIATEIWEMAGGGKC